MSRGQEENNWWYRQEHVVEPRSGNARASVKKSLEVAWGLGSVAPPAANRRPPRSSPPTAAPHLLRPTAGHRDLPRPQPRRFLVGHILPRRPHPRRLSRRGAPWSRRTDRR